MQTHSEAASCQPRLARLHRCKHHCFLSQDRSNTRCPPFRMWSRPAWTCKVRIAASVRACTAARRSSEAGAARCGAAAPTPEQPVGNKQRPRRRIKLLEACVQRFPEYDARLLTSLILQGKVLVDDTPVDKVGTLVPTAAALRIKGAPCRFVSRAGLKLDAALQHFSVDVRGRTALDAGLSTGGFADCLLQRGAERVFGVDVGDAQVAGSLRQNPRMVVMDHTNLRYLTAADLPERPSLVTLDLSFISVLTVMPAVSEFLSEGGEIVSLIKPQFEARREQIEAGGVVTNPSVHTEVCQRITAGIEAQGFRNHGIMESPVRGAVSKNIEFFLHASRN